MKLKATLYALALSLVYTNVHAQEGVNFRDLTFDEATALAKKENKIVFVDVRGLNAPAAVEKVEKEILSIDTISKFLNDNCVSIRVFMGTDEGKKFAPKLAMLMYPVYVFHDSKGDQLDFINAAAILKDPATLMAKARASLAEAKVKRENLRAIHFASENWSDALARAKKENKLIFLDSYTQWCRPCILMAKNVFTLDKVADFYNNNFINVSMDMEKGDGPAVGKKYKIGAYPTFLYIDGSGKVVHKSSGYQEAEEFIKAGEKAVEKKAKAGK